MTETVIVKDAGSDDTSRVDDIKDDLEKLEDKVEETEEQLEDQIDELEEKLEDKLEKHEEVDKWHEKELSSLAEKVTRLETVLEQVTTNLSSLIQANSNPEPQPEVEMATMEAPEALQSDEEESPVAEPPKRRVTFL